VVPGFSIDVTEADGAAVVCLGGDLDLATAPLVRQALFGLVERSVRLVTVDLAHLDFLDSTGLTALVSGLKRLREFGGDLMLRSPNRTVVKLLHITGLDRVFTIT